MSRESLAFKILMPTHSALADSAVRTPQSAFNENLLFLQRGLNAMIRDGEWVKAEEFAQALHQYLRVKVLESSGNAAGVVQLKPKGDSRS